VSYPTDTDQLPPEELRRQLHAAVEVVSPPAPDTSTLLAVVRRRIAARRARNRTVTAAMLVAAVVVVVLVAGPLASRSRKVQVNTPATQPQVTTPATEPLATSTTVAASTTVAPTTVATLPAVPTGFSTQSDTFSGGGTGIASVNDSVTSDQLDAVGSVERWVINLGAPAVSYTVGYVSTPPTDEMVIGGPKVLAGRAFLEVTVNGDLPLCSCGSIDHVDNGVVDDYAGLIRTSPPDTYLAVGLTSVLPFRAYVVADPGDRGYSNPHDLVIDILDPGVRTAPAPYVPPGG
jgi:hypothetical protein